VFVRVAIDARLLAYQQAGTATYIRGILSGLRQLDDAPELTVVVSPKHLTDGSFADNRRVVSYTPCHHRLERWSLGLELAALPVDVVHSPDYIPPRRLGRRWGRVITVHDLAFLKWPELLTPPSRAYYGQVFAAARAADRIIAVSEATRDDLLDLVSESISPKITVIPEGVGAQFRPVERTAAQEQVRRCFGIERPFFLFVGTTEPRKNLARLLQAFSNMRHVDEYAGIDLVLAGAPGWLDDDVDRLSRSLGDAVHRLGRVSASELVALYNAALALTLVSIDEGFGLPAVEAMACGTPVIVSRVGALPEVVGDAGLFVEPGEVDSIGNQLRRIIDDTSLHHDLAKRGLCRAASYQWTAVATRTARVYAEAAACAS
jgi:glycosyltransferase involved in cell wall biosynthesis